MPVLLTCAAHIVATVCAHVRAFVRLSLCLRLGRVVFCACPARACLRVQICMRARVQCNRIAALIHESGVIKKRPAQLIAHARVPVLKCELLRCGLAAGRACLRLPLLFRFALAATPSRRFAA